MPRRGAPLKRRFIMFCLLGAVLVIAIAVTAFALFTPKQPAATASMVKSKTDSVQGGAGGVGTKQYIELDANTKWWEIVDALFKEALIK